MDPSALLAGGAIGLIAILIGIAIGVVIGALFIMLGTKIVMGSSAKFGSACIATIASGVAGFVVGLVLQFGIMAVDPSLLMVGSLVGLAANFVIYPLIYSATIRTNDDRAPNFGQGLLIYLVQVAIAIAIIIAVVMLFQVPLSGLTGGY